MTKKNFLIGLIVVLGVLAIVILGIQFGTLKMENEKQQEDLAAFEELFEWEKQQQEQEMLSLQAEIEGYRGMPIGNDSLLAKLDEQKQKIQLLLEELKQVKSTSGKRIKELQEELSVVRLVLRDYIRQVDSLNRINYALTEENIKVKAQIKETQQQVNVLTEQKQSMSEVITRASRLEADQISVETLTKKGKSTKKLRKINKIAITFSIAKNVTANTGYKTVYLRILKPSQEVICKNKNRDVFSFEGAKIPYTAKRDIEYKGERLTETVYYIVNETLLSGSYKVDLFADGQVIGTTKFKLN